MYKVTSVYLSSSINQTVLRFVDEAGKRYEQQARPESYDSIYNKMPPGTTFDAVLTLGKTDTYANVSTGKTVSVTHVDISKITNVARKTPFEEVLGA